MPHFEKMLYDNALLATAYLEAYQATGNADYARVARETLRLRARVHDRPAGGFHSTEDADSEGEEGKFYVWTPAEIHAVLGPERGADFCYVYDVTDGGNFEQARTFSICRRRSPNARRSKAGTPTSWPRNSPTPAHGSWPSATNGCVPARTTRCW